MDSIPLDSSEDNAGDMTLQEFYRWNMRSHANDATKFRKYGVSPVMYEQMLEAQGGICASCGQPETHLYKGRPKKLAIDHSHATGKVRALLCSGCNTALGMLKDDPERIQKLLEYVKKWQED